MPACYAINLAARLLSQTIARRLALLGMSPGQLSALLALYEHEGRTQTELARIVDVEQPTMALALRRMQRDGLITRVPDNRDGRRSLVYLTARARDAETAVQAARRDIDAAVLNGLSPIEQHTLEHMLSRLIANLEAVLDDASAPTS